MAVAGGTLPGLEVKKACAQKVLLFTTVASWVVRVDVIWVDRV